MNSIDLAYFLYSYRWIFRAIFIVLILFGSVQTFQHKNKWWHLSALLSICVISWLINYKMSADKMFLQAQNIKLKSQQDNKVPGSRLVVGLENNGEAKAYPIAFLAYHHQVQDSLGGKPILITYCSVCRSGRVFEPIVEGQYVKFRLVGMDHFNAMFEDDATGSWWRQSTGEAIAGKLKGQDLPELLCRQMTVDMWYRLYPYGKVMQPDEIFIASYDSLAKFELGKSKSLLTRTDTLSWKNKSWVVGVSIGNASKAYDWNDLKRKRIINDTIGKMALVLALSSDGQSIAAFERPVYATFTIHRDTLFSGGVAFDFSGQDLQIPSNKLKPVKAYQEFWHSWVTFHANTQKYVDK